MKRLIVLLVMLICMFSPARQAVAQTPTPDPATTSSDCIDIQWAYPMATRLHETNDEITDVRSNIDSSSFVSVTISSDPVSMAQGFIFVMSDVAWLQILFVFFILAFTLILILMAIRFAVSSWGVVERIIEIIKLIPFIG